MSAEHTTTLGRAKAGAPLTPGAGVVEPSAPTSRAAQSGDAKPGHVPEARADSTASAIDLHACEQLDRQRPADYHPAAYGDGCAEFYDQLYPRLPVPVLTTLLDLAAGRPLLDLGVGTGRAAVALAAHGCEVWGIDASVAMLRRLRERARGLSVTAVQGDLARFCLPQRFGLVFSLVNTLALLPPDDQQECLHCAAAHLLEDGLLLVESSGLPDDVGRVCVSLHTTVGVREYRVQLFGASLQQLDQMAERAGLELQARWQNWQCQPGCASSGEGISVYRKR